MSQGNGCIWGIGFLALVLAFTWYCDSDLAINAGKIAEARKDKDAAYDRYVERSSPGSGYTKEAVAKAKTEYEEAKKYAEQGVYLRCQTGEFGRQEDVVRSQIGYPPRPTVWDWVSMFLFWICTVSFVFNGARLMSGCASDGQRIMWGFSGFVLMFYILAYGWVVTILYAVGSLFVLNLCKDAGEASRDAGSYVRRSIRRRAGLED